MATTPYHPWASTPLHDAVTHSENAESTKYNYYRHLDRFVEYAGVQPQGWTRERFRKFYDKLIDEEKLKPQSANGIVFTIRFAAKAWAEEINDPSVATFVDIKLKKSCDVEEQPALTREQMHALLAPCRNSACPTDIRDHALMGFALETGARAMTLTGARWEKIQYDGNRKYTSILAPIKGKMSNYKIPLTQLAGTFLQPWKDWCQTKGIVEGPIFRKLRNGKASAGPLTENGIWRIIKKRGEAAGLPWLHPHTFRHTLVTWRLVAKVPPSTIMQTTGHESIGMIHRYADRTALHEHAAHSTPEWLAADFAADMEAYLRASSS